MKTYIPPLKTQGKKTKLLPCIIKKIPNEYDTWIEPFMGSGVVGFNINPNKAIFADNNPHIISLYSSIYKGEIVSVTARTFFEDNGNKLAKYGDAYYKEVRTRFNSEHQPLDFLFLSRCNFNGLIRFNKKGEYNVPFGHKPERFSKTYITKICNQIKHLSVISEGKDWKFVCQDFKDTISFATESDLIYCDPPYIGRNVGYYDNIWDGQQENRLEKELSKSGAKFMLSSWHSDQYRYNSYLDTTWSEYNIEKIAHKYQIGAKEINRYGVFEAVVTNF